VGRKSQTGGVAARGDRIEFDFAYQGKRRRPTIEQTPNASNLRQARRRLVAIKRAIEDGTFSFAEEFPDYRFIEAIENAGAGRTVSQVCAAYIASLRARAELAYATIESYRKILAHHVEPELGDTAFASVAFSQLDAITTAHQGSKKTFNNVASAIRGAWAYGYKDLPRQQNPALGLEGVRIPRREQPQPDPFDIDAAEEHIAETRVLWGEEQANYEEFRFFSGVRPSEEIPLRWPDCDLARGEVAINKARVMAHDKTETKNYIDRLLELCPRALDVLLRQRAIWSRLKLAGKIDHDFVFFRQDGKPFHDLQIQWIRWTRTQQSLRARERTPYSARHSSVSWNLMMGKNFLWVAEQHGHSPEVMLKSYAKWARGATEQDIEKIRRAFGFVSSLSVEKFANEHIAMNGQRKVVAEREGFEPSITV